jgi:hypothetical protein
VHRDDLWFRFERDGHDLLAVITDPSAVETFVAEIIDPVGELKTVLTATGSYPLDGGPRTYRFDGRGGQLAIVTATHVDTALDPGIRLYDPDGALKDSDACCDPVMQDNLPDDVTNVAGRDLRLTLPLDTRGSCEVEVEAGVQVGVVRRTTRPDGDRPAAGSVVDPARGGRPPALPPRATTGGSLTRPRT